MVDCRLEGSEEEGGLRAYIGIYLAVAACLAGCGLLSLLLRRGGCWAGVACTVP